MTRVVIDPITRIEGHLRIEVEVKNGKVVDAWSSGTMFRGFEVLLRGRDPRDATYVTERICGVCAGSHGWASSLCLDDAFGAQVPDLGRVLRNLILGAMWLHDHVLHFYHLSALDYIDILAVANYRGKDPELLKLKGRLMRLVEAGDLAPFVPRYEPDEFCVRDPDTVITLVAHYVKALEMKAKAQRMSAIFGGKQPHQSTIVVGGVTQLPNAQQIADFRSGLLEQIDFIENVYLPDVIALATGPLLPLAQAGVGAGHGHYLAYGAFDEDATGHNKFLKRGVIWNNRYEEVHPMDPRKITESVHHSWYRGETAHPTQGRTEYDLEKEGAYSFIKAPRYDGKPMEVGPLARMLIQKPKDFWETFRKYRMKPGAVARHLARAVETRELAYAMLRWVDELAEMIGAGNTRIHDTAHWDPPRNAQGMGLTEAPRGALGHWVEIENYKIKNYQAVVPTTWNGSPRDEHNQRGPFEESLIGTPVPDPENPINVVRVIRSFDPCLACAVHLIHPQTNEILKFRVI